LLKAVHYAAFGPILGLMVAATFPVFLSGVDLYKNSFSSLLTMDKLQLMGLNPGRVFNSRSD
jgi:hypothetical protein